MMHTGHRRTLAGLGIGGGVLAVLAALALAAPAAILVSGRTCACAQPPDVIVQNMTTRPVTLSWHQQGVAGMLDGRHGTERVEACDAFHGTLPQGHIEVTVTSAAESQTFELDIPQRYASDPFGSYVVREDGRVQDVTHADPAAQPTPATCGIMGS